MTQQNIQQSHVGSSGGTAESHAAHDELLAATKAMVALVEWAASDEPNGPEPENGDAVLARVKAAIAAADGATDLSAMREETIYEKSARWNWPDGRPDL